jgi:hypothetical protein
MTSESSIRTAHRTGDQEPDKHTHAHGHGGDGDGPTTSIDPRSRGHTHVTPAAGTSGP